MKTRSVTAAISVLAILACSGVASRTLAFDEPSGFREVAWGSSSGDLRKKLPVDYCGDNPQAGHFCRSKTLRIGEVPIGHAVFQFTNDAFDGVMLRFDPKDFDKLSAVFVERYGPPTSQEIQELETRAGGRVTNPILMWSGTATAIRIMRYDPNWQPFLAD